MKSNENWTVITDPEEMKKAIENVGAKMNQKSDGMSTMDEMFGTEPDNTLPAIREPREVLVKPVITHGPIGSDERKNDLAVTRETLHRILTKAEDALDDMMHLARSSEHPRSFEVTGQLIKTVTDVATQLIDLHKKAKDLEDEGDGDDAPQQVNIENQTNVFTGTTAELLAAMKKAGQHQPKEIVINADEIGKET